MAGTENVRDQKSSLLNMIQDAIGKTKTSKTATDPQADTKMGFSDNEWHDSAGRPIAAPGGPRGARMAQLGILTRAQRKAPAPPKIRTGLDGKPNPGDLENAKMQSTLQQKYQEQLAGQAAAGPANSITEQNPMMVSRVPRAPVKTPR